MNKFLPVVKGVVMDWADVTRPFMVDDRNATKWVMVDGNTTDLVEHVCTEVCSGITEEYIVAEAVDAVTTYLEKCVAMTYSEMEKYVVDMYKESGDDEVDVYGHTFSKIELLAVNDPTALREMVFNYCDSLARGEYVRTSET